MALIPLVSITALTAVTVPFRIATPILQVFFQEHSVGLGVRLSLPSSWVLDSKEQLVKLRKGSLQSMRSSTLAQLRALAAQNDNALVFRAQDPSRHSNSANMNVTVLPSMTVDAYEQLAEGDFTAIVSELCNLFSAQTKEFGGVGECTGHDLMALQGRKVLVVYQRATVPRAGLNNRRVVAMIPADGALFTLSISLRTEDYEAEVPRTVLASLRFKAP
jgi:hypothetical protein